MAIKNINGAEAGLSLSSSLQSITDTCIVGICNIEEANDDGEAFIVCANNGGKYLGLTYDLNAGPVVTVRLSWDGGWEVLSANLCPTESWFAWGINCAGAGSNQLTIMLSTSQGATPESFARTLGGSAWTPSAIRLLHDTVLARGAVATLQNVKYGDAGLTAAKMHAEAWDLAVQNPGDWTPTVTEMVTGDLTAQRESWSAVSSSDLAVVPGYFVDMGGSTATITVTSATPAGDAMTVEGSITSDAETQSVSIELVKDGSIAQTIPATLIGLNWTCTIDDIPAGVYTVRGRVVDALGSATHELGSTVEFIGFSGEDTLPHTYPNTGLGAVPSIASIPVGETATFKSVNQAGVAVPGAIVTINNPAIASAAAGLTDADGNIVVTGAAQGTTTLVLSIMNLGGATLNTQVPLTIGAPSVSTVTVTPATATIAAGQTQQFTGVVTGGGSITWSVQSGGGSIDSNGLYTAPGGAAVAVIRGAKTGDLGVYDESTVTVTAQPQSSIGAQFLGNANMAVAPGQSFSWRIKVEVDGEAFQGAVITPSAIPNDLLSITQPLATAADGTTTITAQAASDIDTGIEAAVTFNIVAGGLSMQLTATVSIVDSPFGYLDLRGRSYPRPYKQN